MNGYWPPKYQYKARTIIGYLNRLVLGNVYEAVYKLQPDYNNSGAMTYILAVEEWYLNRIRWAAEASVTVWTGQTAGFYDLPNQGDGIRRFGVFQDLTMLAFRDKSVYIITPSKDPYQLLVDQGPLTNRGIWAANSLQQVRATPRSSDPRFRLTEEESFIYLGHDDIYRIDARGGESIGTPIRVEFFNTVDPTKLLNAWSFQDTADKKYYLVTILKDGTQHAWIYDWEEKTWSRQDFLDYTSVGEGPRATLGGRRSMSITETIYPKDQATAILNPGSTDFRVIIRDFPAPEEAFTYVKTP